jgi:hypothetical protein
MLHKTRLKVEQSFPFFAVLASCKNTSISFVRADFTPLTREVHQSNI